MRTAAIGIVVAAVALRGLYSRADGASPMASASGGRVTGQNGGSAAHHAYFAPNAPRTPFRFSPSAAPTAN